MTGPGSPPLAWTELERLVAAGDVDTVIVAFTDMQGRLAGKRISGRHFVDDIATRGVECCSYLLAVDVDLNTVPGYAMASWDTGYGDMVMTPDLSTLRLIPWLPGTALVIADLVWADGSEVAVSPRSILRRQLDRLKARGLVADVATELEFIVFDQPYRQAWASGYRGLTPASDYNIDYAILASSRMEPLLRDIRLGMAGAGLRFEAVKGECNMGQQEIGFRYDEALVTCDNHAIYKNGAKEIADQHGKSLTFMAKYDEREGNSCHIHVSLRGTDGSAVFADSNGPHGMSSMFRSFVAGQLATLREFTLCYAPTINSYKRFADSSFAPTALAWGLDNRTCALRVVGHGQNIRVECRVPGGDQPVPGGGGSHCWRVVRYRAGPSAARALCRQRLPRRRCRTAAGYAGRRRGAVRGFCAGARGVRRGCCRALPEQRACGAGGVQRGGHRLGEDTWI